MNDVVGLDVSRGKPFIRKEGRGVIKDSFKPVKSTEVVPLRGRLILRRVDRFKPIIINNVILGGQITSLEIANQTNVFSMARRGAAILSSTGSRLPLGNLATGVSQPWFQNISRTPPGMRAAEGDTIIFGGGEDLNRCNARLTVGSMVVEIRGMVEGKGPQGRIFNLRPHQVGMNHHGPSPGDNKAKGSLGDAILPFCTNSTIPNGQNITNNLFHKPSTLENAIVGVIPFNNDPRIK
jgi:hypothetical protein